MRSKRHGFALQERGLPFTNAGELAEVASTMLEQVLADDYPNLTGVSSELLASGFNYADEFEVGLELILDGMERTWTST